RRRMMRTVIQGAARREDRPRDCSCIVILTPTFVGPRGFTFILNFLDCSHASRFHSSFPDLSCSLPNLVRHLFRVTPLSSTTTNHHLVLWRVKTQGVAYRAHV